MFWSGCLIIIPPIFQRKNPLLFEYCVEEAGTILQVHFVFPGDFPYLNKVDVMIVGFVWFATSMIPLYWRGAMLLSPWPLYWSEDC